ncbi:MAG: glucosamine 6-phosphate synthetase [Eubacteriales bacterium]
MTFKLPNGTSCITGHTRHTTQGSEKRKYNNHPFKGRTRKGSHFALSHNGIISNDRSLRKTLSLPATKIETDSFIAVQLLEREKKLSFKSIAKMVEQVTGSYSFSILDDQNNVYLVKGDSPLAILHLTRLKLYVYASTEQILWKALTSSMLKELKDGCFEEITVREGEILKIAPTGILSYGEFNFTPNSYDTYGWWIYFNKPANKKPVAKEDSDYISQLKGMAFMYGYSSEDVDYMLSSGFTPEEIEEAMYSEDTQCMMA